MQTKIPQEINVEDKIVGPFTLKGFGFIMAGVILTICLMLIFMQVGLSFVPSLIVGAFLGSFFWIIGFVPFNGKPLYTYSLSFVNFMMKPRQRVWKRIEDKPKGEEAPQTEKEQALQSETTDYIIPKARIEEAESQIEDISLLVDTGGAYAVKKSQQKQAEDIFTQNDSPQLKDSLASARSRVETNQPKSEPTISQMASVDPDKKFEHPYPNTSNYKMDRVYPAKEEEENVS